MADEGRNLARRAAEERQDGPHARATSGRPSGPASDVRIMNSLPLAVVGKIITEGVLIYCHDDKARVDYETAIRIRVLHFFMHSL